MNGNTQSNSYKILIIDDDEDLSMIISDMLTDYGYRVTHVTDGNGAFDLLSDNTYHLILLDINLPDADGFSICRELRRVSTVPVLFASARTSETDRVEGYDIGGDDYLSKPYSMKELLAHVNALIRRTYGFSQQEQQKRSFRFSFPAGIRPAGLPLPAPEYSHSKRHAALGGLGRVLGSGTFHACCTHSLAEGKAGGQSRCAAIHQNCLPCRLSAGGEAA